MGTTGTCVGDLRSTRIAVLGIIVCAVGVAAACSDGPTTPQHRTPATILKMEEGDGSSCYEEDDELICDDDTWDGEDDPGDALPSDAQMQMINQSIDQITCAEVRDALRGVLNSGNMVVWNDQNPADRRNWGQTVYNEGDLSSPNTIIRLNPTNFGIKAELDSTLRHEYVHWAEADTSAASEGRAQMMQSVCW